MKTRSFRIVTLTTLLLTNQNSVIIQTVVTLETKRKSVDMESKWQRVNVGQNLRLVVKDKLIITDDDKRFISLPTQMFWELLRELDHITKAFEDIIDHKDVNFTQHLGSNFYVSLSSPYWIVHIRQWFRNEKNEHKPGKGISLKIQEWRAVSKALKNSFDLSHMHDFLPCYVEHRSAL